MQRTTDEQADVGSKDDKRKNAVKERKIEKIGRKTLRPRGRGKKTNGVTS